MLARVLGFAGALTRNRCVLVSGRFFDMVEWRRMLERDYKPPMVPSLAHDLDLSFFDPTFTAEPPYATLPTCVDASWLTLLHTLAAVIGCHSVLRLLVWVLLHRCENLCVCSRCTVCTGRWYRMRPRTEDRSAFPFACHRRNSSNAVVCSKGLPTRGLSRL